MGKKSSRRTRRAKKRSKQRGGSAQTKLFQDAYTITLPTHPKRWTNMLDKATKANIPLKPWKGVMLEADFVKLLNTLPAIGVGSTHFKDRGGKIFNLGVIGAFLAHRDLYNHIAHTGKGKLGTFISEDDIDIQPDFHAKLIALEPEIDAHAADWDIIFLDKNHPTVVGKKVSANLMKLDRDITGLKNWGIWSYIVRNESVATKILPHFQEMLDVPDIQLARFADKINMYLITPPITYADPETAFQSVVTEKNSR